MSTRGKFPLVSVESSQCSLLSGVDSCKLPETRGPSVCLRIGPIDFSAGSRTGPQFKNRPGLLPGRNPEFYLAIKIASFQPPYSLDYVIWGILEAKVNAIQHRSLDSLKKILWDEWGKLSMATVRNLVVSWRRQLRAVVK